MWLAIFVFLIGSLLFLHQSWRIYTSTYSFLPNFQHLPWIGSVLYLERTPHKLFQQVHALSEKYKYRFLVWFGFQPVIISSCVEYSESLLSNKDNLRKAWLYWPLHEWLGTGLLTSSGGKWKKRRRDITPTFHFAVLNSFTEIFVEHAECLVEKLKSHADTGIPFDIQEPVSLASLDVICETSMGVKINAQGNANSEYVKAVSSMNSCLQKIQRYPWFWIKFILWLSATGREYYKNLKILHTFTAQVINNSIKSRKGTEDSKTKEDSTRKKVFLDMLLDLYDKGDIDVEGIREEVDTFMFEGHDTTASALGWTLYLLGRNPDVQEKLHNEIDEIMQKDGSVVDKIRTMKYLEYVIKEGLRLHPPVAMFGRSLEKDTVIDGNVIPKGTDLGIFTYALHRNPNYWEEPNRFNPDRFGDDAYLKRNPYIYVPFSAGPRNCVGQKFAMLELKIILFHIMSNFNVESDQSDNDTEASFEIIHRSTNGLFIKLLSR